jgi:hypothetical protein
MKKTCLLFLILIIPFFAFSQSLEIIYDASNGTMTYFQNGLEVGSPIAKKGQKIIVKVQNYNNYLYELDVKEVQEERKISSGTDFLNGMQGLGLNQFAELMSPTPNLEGNAVVGNSVRVKDLEFFEDKEAQIISFLKLQATDKLENIQWHKDAFVQTEGKIEEHQKYTNFRNIALNEVNKLKYHPGISTKKIKKTSLSLLETVLNISNNNDVTLAEVVDKNDQEKHLKSLLRKQEKEEEAYINDVAELQQIKSSLSDRMSNEVAMTKVFSNEVALMQLFFNMEEKITEMPTVLEKSMAIKTTLNDLIVIEKNKSISDLLNLWYEYESINSNDFSTTYLSRAEGDQVVLNLAFQLKETVPDSVAAPRTIQLAPVRIPVYGKLKINASVGFSFGQYFNQPKSYFVRDSIILSQDGDSFIPLMTSFVHFYRQSKGMVSVGGSLGVGIPLNGAGLEATSFFLGPSIFFGESERFVLNMGLLGGKVNRLAVGYKEGDLYRGDENFIPIQGLYELGFFLGLSFNLRG